MKFGIIALGYKCLADFPHESRFAGARAAFEDKYAIGFSGDM